MLDPITSIYLANIITMEFKLKEREYNDNYDILLGGDNFSEEVNKKISEYWVRTGGEMSLILAAIEVLADSYNKNK